MSLFKTRELWSTASDNDLFDVGCLRVVNLGINNNGAHNSIVTGSYNGFLRIYNPTPVRQQQQQQQQPQQTPLSSLTSAHDLVNETSFPSPIIQIETGRFVSTSSKQHIAVLMPKKLAIYEAICKQTKTKTKQCTFVL